VLIVFRIARKRSGFRKRSRPCICMKCRLMKCLCTEHLSIDTKKIIMVLLLRRRLSRQRRPRGVPALPHSSRLYFPALFPWLVNSVNGITVNLPYESRVKWWHLVCPYAGDRGPGLHSHGTIGELSSPSEPCGHTLSRIESRSHPPPHS